MGFTCLLWVRMITLPVTRRSRATVAASAGRAPASERLGLLAARVEVFQLQTRGTLARRVDNFDFPCGRFDRGDLVTFDVSCPGISKFGSLCAVCGEQAASVELLPPGLWPGFVDDLPVKIREFCTRRSARRSPGGCATRVSQREMDREILLAKMKLSVSRSASRSR